MHFVRWLLVLAIIVSASLPAQADPLAVINALRSKECAGHLPTTLQHNARLSAAAKLVNGGVAIRDALQRSEYRSEKTAAIRINGSLDDAALKRMLAKNYCATLTNMELTEVGIASTSKAIAIVLAAPFTPPSPAEAQKVAKQVLQLVNEARAKSRRCGKQQFKAAAPLVFNDKLFVAAAAHAKDMAKRGVVTHDGADGSSPDVRATRAGYKWSSVGENVAGGQLSATEVMSGWLASPGHCANIMDTNFTQMAVAYVINPRQKIGIYWAQEFDRPQ